MYNDPTAGTALYNGNISQTSWKTANEDSSLKRYDYQYDALNRITAASGANTSNYDLDLVQYDKNGNITNLQRKGHTNLEATAFGTMDNLSYDYGVANGNKLLSVTDTGNTTYGFKDGNTSGDDYAYDDNGNLTKDRNKGITNIVYNHLNLPIRVVFGSASNMIKYRYDASGTKLQKEVIDNGNSIITKYANGFIYEEDELQFFGHPEGYVQKDGLGNFEYVYQFTDHLGNIRLSYSDINKNGTIEASTEILQERNYYPFGLEHKGYNNVVSANANSTAGNWRYNGKEITEDLGLDTYDFGARNYDASLGRWMSIDPLARDYFSNSPYNYALNNPILYIDPDGARVEWGDGLTRKEKELIGYAITYLRRNSETFDKVFTKLHESKSIFKISEGDLGGASAEFGANAEEVFDLDENGEPNYYTEDGIIGSKPNNPGGTITFDLSKGREDNRKPENSAPEEFAHAYQYLTYTEGKFHYYDTYPDRGNIEYEGQMISGIIKNEAGIRLNKKYATNRAGERDGIRFGNVSQFSEGLNKWYNRADNYYRINQGATINSSILPTALLKIIQK